MPVKTMLILSSSQAAITSLSRLDPPGHITLVMPCKPAELELETASVKARIRNILKQLK